MYERFTDRARKVMQLANQEALRLNHEYIGTEHILVGLVKEGSGVGVQALTNCGVDLRQIRLEVAKLVRMGANQIVQGKLPQTPQAKKVIEFSMNESQELGDNYVGTEHILLGLLRVKRHVAGQALIRLGLSHELVREEIRSLRGDSAAEGLEKRQHAQRIPNMAGRRRASSMLQQAASGGFPPFVGLDDQLERLQTALCRTWRNSVLLVGEPGSGKRALVERLAVEIIQERPEPPYACNIHEVDPSQVSPPKLADDLSTKKDVLLIENVDLLVSHFTLESGTASWAHGLRPLMEAGLRCIGTTTIHGAKIIANEPSFAACFTNLYVGPANREKCIAIAKSRVEAFRDQHLLTLTDGAITEAYELSQLFGDRLYPAHVQPSLMLDVLEHAAAYAGRFTAPGPDGLRELDAKDVAMSVATRVNKPVDDLRRDN